MASSIVQEVRQALAAGRAREAAQRLLGGAAAGDPAAAAELAHWRIAGNIVRRDLAQARDLLGQAGRAGDVEAALLHASFLAAGVGGEEDFAAALAALRTLAPAEPRAAAQLRLLAAMALRPDGGPASLPPTARLGGSPRVEACKVLLTPAECDYLRRLGEPSLQPALVVDPASGRMVPHPIRTSDGTAFGVYSEDLVVNAINRRIAALSGTAIAQGEPLQLLRYGVGGEYRAHMDGIAGETNQRILTVLVYLSDDYAGGETVFPRTGLSFRGGKGDALLFDNVDAQDRPDPLTLHAGLPVTRGIKLIATRWIRRARFVYPPPPPAFPDLG